jgi:hypothetical protein
MFRPDEVDVDVARTSRAVRRTGPGSLHKRGCEEEGLGGHICKCTQTQGQPLPGVLKLGAQYQCLTTCLFLGSIGLVPFARVILPISEPLLVAKWKRHDRPPSRGFGQTPRLYNTLDTAFGARPSAHGP